MYVVIGVALRAPLCSAAAAERSHAIDAHGGTRASEGARAAHPQPHTAPRGQ